jgi:hypothetical protein
VVNPYAPMEILSADQIEAIHLTSLRILEEIGIELMSPAARAAMRKPGDSTEASIALADGVADPGDRPAAGIGARTTLPVTIVGVDAKTNEVRFYGPDKRVRTVELETPEAQAFAKKLKAGDEVIVTFTEALAVSIEPAR